MKISIRTRVFALASISVLPLVAADLYQATDVRRKALEAGQQEALLLARSFAAGQDDFFDDTRNLLSGFVSSFEAQGRSYAGPGCDTGLRRLLDTNPEHVNIVLADLHGDLVCAARPLRQPINVADRSYFRDALAHGRFVMSDLILSRDSGNYVLVAAHPIFDSEGRVSGILLATLRLEALSQAFERLGVPDHILAHLVDHRGVILARWPPRPDRIGKTLESVHSGPRMLSEKEGLGGYVGADGERRLAAYVRLREITGNPMFVVSGLPREEIERAPRESLAQDLLSLAATIAMALAGGFLGAHVMVVRPVRKLTDAAERYGRGELAARSGIPHGGDEIGKLAGAFDALAEHNQRVTRALKALSAGNQTLLRERNEPELLHAMCKVAVERASYAAAYVLYAREDEAKSIDVAGTYGADEGFITTVPLTWADTEHGQGSIGRCIRSGERAIVRSIAADPSAAPWQAAARRSGFKSVISLPLRVQNALIGTFTLVAREDDAFDEAEVALLDEMAADLSFGIEVIRAEARRKEAEEIARRALTHDSVVDLPNRTAFVRQVQECMQRAQKNGEPVAVLDVHLGRLQDVFDSFGYEHANTTLRQVAERLKKVPGCGENLGRLPIEDFGIVLCGYDAQGAAAVARAALDTFGAPVNVGGALIDVQASVGATFFPGHGDVAEVLMRRAAIAAREGFRREVPYQVYSGATARENPARLSLASDLRAAIETRALMLHYQPKIELAGGTHCGGEALVRWQHPQRHTVSPAEFVPLAEEIGLIRALTYQVLDMAVRQVHAWGVPHPIAINLSARNLHDPLLFDALGGLFATWGVARELVHFEITESALVDDPDAARHAVGQLREGGAKVYIDDFGTGYSSLSYLVQLPVHALKIDRSFIQQMTRSVEARSVVASIISMAHGLDLKVVAEGVETKEDLDLLRGMGCDEAQGYFIARPLDAARYAAWRR